MLNFIFKLIVLISILKISSVNGNEDISQVNNLYQNQILDHVSYQQIKGEFKEPFLNVVLKKGTPKFKKKIKGKVFSLIQGASGNNNYFWKRKNL